MADLPYTRENLPDKYPVDHALLVEAESLGNGAYAHDVNDALGAYRSAVRAYDEGDDGGKAWFDAVRIERRLRGVIAEIKMGRMRITKPLHDFND